MPTPKALLYRQKHKLLRLIVLLHINRHVEKHYVANFDVGFKSKLIHISQIVTKSFQNTSV